MMAALNIAPTSVSENFKEHYHGYARALQNLVNYETIV